MFNDAHKTPTKDKELKTTKFHQIINYCHNSSSNAVHFSSSATYVFY